MKRLIIAGLGNPGKEYENTPHNVGFETIDELIARISDSQVSILKQERPFADVWKTKMNGKEILIVKPLLFMNKSGEALKKVLTDYKLQLANCDLLVIHDDIDIEMGTIKVKRGGGSAGHKGIENIAKSVGTKDFWRFRIGIKPKNAPAKRPPKFMSEFVTKKLSGSALAKMRKSTETCAEMILESLEKGIEKTKRMI